MSWYLDYFREPYGEIYADYLLSPEMAREEAEFAREALGLTKSDRVLDCPCGYGRHMDVLASHLPRLVGIDLDADCLKRGKQWSPRLRMIRGDMRAMPFPDGAFDAVLNLFNSFGYFSEVDNRRVLVEMARVVRPGGQVLIDVANPAPLIDIVSEHPVTEQRVMDLRLTESWFYDAFSGRLHNETRIEKADQVLERKYDLRIYELDEIDTRMGEVGLRRVRMYGEFDGADHDPEESARMIIVAEKQ